MGLRRGQIYVNICDKTATKNRKIWHMISIDVFEKYAIIRFQNPYSTLDDKCIFFYLKLKVVYIYKIKNVKEYTISLFLINLYF